MFKEYVCRNLPLKFNNRLLLVDEDGINDKVHYSDYIRSQGYETVFYSNDLDFRIEYEYVLKNTDKKLAVITLEHDYIPYDIRTRCYEYKVSFSNLFSRLNAAELKNHSNIDYDLLSFAYDKLFGDISSREATRSFLEKDLSKDIKEYIDCLVSKLKGRANECGTYMDWIGLSSQKAYIDVLAAKNAIQIDYAEVNSLFKNFILTSFGKLSSVVNMQSPVIVSKAMEYMHSKSEKFALIVMDGMSQFDWNILKESFEDIEYVETGMYAMIPSTTPISRQCLLSNKYPMQLQHPWQLDKEKNEFVECAKNLGFNDNQIVYGRGYDTQLDLITKCAAIIINDVDDIVHGQRQGKTGMLQSIEHLKTESKLKKLTKELIQSGFDVYITADHGNVDSTGMGQLKGAGIDVETKSRKMLVLKDFADKDMWKNKYDMIDYPKYYLPKEYDYLICDYEKSMDAAGKSVMTHGGISIDEVIVPFITIKAEDNK